MAYASIDAASVVAVLASLALAVYLPDIIKWWRRWFILRSLPSPQAHSIIAGHAGSYNFLAKHKYEYATSSKLGKIWRRREFWRQVVVVADPMLIQEIWALERDGAVDKPSMGSPWSKGKGKSEMNVFSEKASDPMWKVVRKGTAPAFQPSNMRQYHHHVVEVIQRLVDGIKTKGDGAIVDVSDIAQRESFDVIGKVGFGKDFQASRDIDNSVNNTFRLLSNDFEEAMRRIVFPLRRYSRSADKLRGDENHRQMRAIIANLVHECQARPPSQEDANSIAGHLLRLRDPRGRPLSTKRLMEEFSIFFIAGSETTGHTIAWTLYFLTKHPKAMAKLEAELDEAGLLKSAANPNPREITYADISKLHYLDCVIKEAMRLQPVAAQPVRRVAERDFMLSTGHKIPAGTYLEMAQYSMMRNPQWGWEDPEDFKPERWEEPEMEYYESAGSCPAKASANGAKQPSDDELEIDRGHAQPNKAKRFHPFGQGIRNCVGQQLARMNVPTAVAMFVGNFHLQVAPQDAKKSIEELEIVRGTLQPKSGLHMICRSR